MVRGIYTGCMGMLVQMAKLNVVANNIANVNTTGYKKDSTSFKTFNSILIHRIGSRPYVRLKDRIKAIPIGKMETGVVVDRITTDFQPGNYVYTQSPLDLALQGDGFFTIKGADGVYKYTRNGEFSLNSNGLLVTKNGEEVLSITGQPIRINGKFSIDERGYVYVNGKTVDKIMITHFSNNTGLRKIGDNYFIPTTVSGPPLYDTQTKVMQYTIEGSNVNVVKQMVKMIESQRAYEINGRVISTEDQMLDKAVNNILR